MTRDLRQRRLSVYDLAIWAQFYQISALNTSDTSFCDTTKDGEDISLLRTL